MPLSLFDPIQNLHFDSKTCFLTGKDLKSEKEQVCIFPDWILERFSLREKKFRMLDQITGVQYQDLILPCAEEVIGNVLDPLEKEIKTAFEAGYEAVKELPEKRLFQWMGKVVYGVLYNELSLEISRSIKRSKEFKLSPLLRERFGKFHLMLQSLVTPMEFKGLKPWSIRIVKLKYSKDTFNYKDEPINLNFSLGMNDFGIIACLQDNGAVGRNQKDILDKIGDKILHPIQFEELCGRFLYANYLLRRHSKHKIEIRDEKVIVESIPLEDNPDQPLFSTWEDNMFAQVLEGYWEPWGLSKNEIITLPDSPISFLENDYTHELIEPESITLPF
jgi:hypothetical protein